jgi:hypothetical protein
VNFWEWSDARSGNIPGVWDVIQKYNWSEQVITKDICETYVDALNAHDINKILDMYTLPAVHINSTRTIQGFDNLRIWYSQLFHDILPNSKYKLEASPGRQLRHLTWTYFNQGLCTKWK